MRFTRASIVFLVTAIGGLAFGCSNDTTDGSSAYVEGRVTNGDGAQPRSFGGEGTVESSAMVRASAIAADGSLVLLAEAELNADASYTLEVPSHQDALVLQAVDADGELLAAAVLERSGAAGETRTATPMDSESSLEAAVLIEMVAHGGALADANVADLRARIDGELALAVQLAAARGDTSEAVRGLALAVMAAQRAEVEAYARAGVSVTQAELYEAEVEASQALSAALDAGSDATEAHSVFLAELEAAARAMGADAETHARAQSAASVSFRAAVRASVDAEASGLVLEEALLAAAALEARAQAEATGAILEAGAAGSSVMSASVEATERLRADVSAAATIAAAAEAYASFGAAVRGDAGVSGSLLGTYLEVDATTELTVDATVAASAEAAASLDATLDAAIAAATSASGPIDPDALATAVVDAYAAYYDAVEAETLALAATSGDASAHAAASLLIVADGSFRVGG